MPGRLQGRKIVVLVDEGFEDLEFWVTVMRLREEGAAVTIAGPKPGEAVHGKHCLEATADVTLTSAQSLITPPGEKVVITAPLAGALPALIDSSLQLSGMDLRLNVPPEPFVIHIRSFAERML